MRLPHELRNLEGRKLLHRDRRLKSADGIPFCVSPRICSRLGRWTARNYRSS
jgi:hypothetical protein